MSKSIGFPRRSPRLIKAQQEVARAMHIPHDYGFYCAFERNGHVVKRTAKELYWHLMNRVAGYRSGALQGTKTSVSSALRTLELARKVRDGSSLPRVQWVLNFPADFYGGVHYKAGTRVEPLKGFAREYFLKNSYQQELSPEYDVYRVKEHVFVCRRDHVERRLVPA